MGPLEIRNKRCKAYNIYWLESLANHEVNKLLHRNLRRSAARIRLTPKPSVGSSPRCDVFACSMNASGPGGKRFKVPPHPHDLIHAEDTLSFQSW